MNYFVILLLCTESQLILGVQQVRSNTRAVFDIIEMIRERAVQACKAFYLQFISANIQGIIKKMFVHYNSNLFKPTSQLRDTEAIVLVSLASEWSLRNISTVCPYKLQGHIDKMNSGALTSDGKRALTQSHDYTAILWNLNDRNNIWLYPLEGHANNINAVLLTCNGRWALTGSYGPTMRLWDLSDTTNDSLHSLGEHTGLIHSVSLISDARGDFTRSHDYIARLWNLRYRSTTHSTIVLGHTGCILSGYLAPDDWGLSCKRYSLGSFTGYAIV